MNFTLSLCISNAQPVGQTGPGLSLSSLSVPENSAQGTDVATLTPTNASNPGAVSIAAQSVANLFQMNVDGVTLEVGSGFAGLNYEVRTSATVTLQYTDDNGTYQFLKTISIGDVDDGPTTTGAATTLEAMVGSPVVGTQIADDLRDLWVSPTGQTLTFTVSHGSIAGNGFDWTWTPSTAQFETITVTATDEDGQQASVELGVTVTAANQAPTAGDLTLEFAVAEFGNPAISSTNPADNATGIGVAVNPSVTFDRNIVFGASGTITLYDVTGAAVFEAFDVATEQGTGAGQVSITDATLTLNTTSNFSNSNEYAIQWTAGAVESAEGAEVAALTDTTTISFTTSAGASAPDQFAAGGWSVSDLGTNGDIRITITTLPSDGGSAITDLEYQVDGGSWTSLAGTTTGNYDRSGFTDGTQVAIAVRAVNAIGNGAASATKNVTPTGVPAAFVVGNWTLTDLTTGGDARIAISALPATNGSAITDLERKIGAGAWTSLGGTTTGNYDLNDLFTDGVSTNVLIRAVNANGNGADSDTKSVTTTSGGTSAPQIKGWKTLNFNAQSTQDFDLTAFEDGVLTNITAAENDIVAVIFATSANGQKTISIDTTGYTILNPGTVRYVNDTSDVTVIAGYKRMGSTPDTTLTVNPGDSGTSQQKTAVAVIISGVNTTTAADDTGQTDQSLNSALIDCPSVTPAQDNSLILALGALATANNSLTLVGPANMDGYKAADTTTSTKTSMSMIAWYEQATAAAFNPDAVTLSAGSDSTAFCWAGYTIVFKPV